MYKFDPDDPAKDDLKWEPPKTSGFKPGGPTDEDYHNWKCKDCPGPHIWDHSNHCTRCGEPSIATFCDRCNKPGFGSALKVTVVDTIYDPWEGSPVLQLSELDEVVDGVDEMLDVMEEPNDRLQRRTGRHFGAAFDNPGGCYGWTRAGNS